MQSSSAPSAHRFDSWVFYGAIVIPSVIAVVIFAWVLLNLGRLPELIPVHWTSTGPDGGQRRPDQFLEPLQAAVFGLVINLSCVQLAWLGVRFHDPSVVRRTTAASMVAIDSVIFATTTALISGALDATDPHQVLFPGHIVAIGAAVGLIAAAVLWVQIPEHPPLADDIVTTAPLSSLPRGSATGESRVTCGIGTKIVIVLWLLVAGAMLFVEVAVGLILLFSAPVLLYSYSSGIVVREDGFEVFIGIGRFRLRHPVPFEVVRYAHVGKYHWGDGGGAGLRLGNDGRISAAARTGEAVKVETSGPNYTVVVPEGTAAAVAGDINARLDALRTPAV